MNDVIKWLESPEGEFWSRRKHDTDGYRYFLMTVKPDDGANMHEQDLLWYA